MPGVRYGALYYRYLEMDKAAALKQSRGNFDASMLLSHEGIVETQWRVNHLDACQNFLEGSPIAVTIYSDVSPQE